MQHDDMIWQVINNQFCSYKSHIAVDEKRKRQFCRNPYSVTGLCDRGSCPLANSKYATIREEEGKVHLYVKTVERAHTPKNLWEKILLSRNYNKALEQIDEHLAYFPTRLIHRNKQRLTKIHQYLIRMRKLKLNRMNKPKLARVNRKIEQREERREVKALKAAKVERSIEQELVDRLAKGTYGDIYNFPEVQYQKALEKVGAENEEDEAELEEEMEYEMDDDEISDSGIVEYVEDFDEEDDLSDVEDFEYGDDSAEDSDEEEPSDDDLDDSSADENDRDGKKSKPEKGTSDNRKKKRSTKTSNKKGPHIEIEYEEENEEQEMQESIAGMAW
mmetsp:Transcript_29253/g.45457  ORF Transcript_29253/g.45457 Transcript_29253/m.45457 type:complete len:331 (-) Transcript_29253:35-1027(-)